MFIYQSPLKASPREKCPIQARPNSCIPLTRRRQVAPLCSTTELRSPSGEITSQNTVIACGTAPLRRGTRHQHFITRFYITLRTKFANCGCKGGPGACATGLIRFGFIFYDCRRIFDGPDTTSSIVCKIFMPIRTDKVYERWTGRIISILKFFGRIHKRTRDRKPSRKDNSPDNVPRN
jgi:hypothetical protein